MSSDHLSFHIRNPVVELRTQRAAFLTPLSGSTRSRSFPITITIISPARTPERKISIYYSTFPSSRQSASYNPLLIMPPPSQAFLSFLVLPHLSHLLLILQPPGVRVRDPDETTQSHGHNKALKYSSITQENSRSVHVDASTSAGCITPPSFECAVRHARLHPVFQLSIIRS